MEEKRDDQELQPCSYFFHDCLPRAIIPYHVVNHYNMASVVFVGFAVEDVLLWRE